MCNSFVSSTSLWQEFHSTLTTFIHVTSDMLYKHNVNATCSIAQRDLETIFSLCQGAPFDVAFQPVRWDNDVVSSVIASG